MKKLDYRAIGLGMVLFIFLYCLSWNYESRLFWTEVSRYRMATGSSDSFSVGKQVVYDWKVLFVSFLLRLFSFGIPSILIAFMSKKDPMRNTIAFGILGAIGVPVFWLVATGFRGGELIEYPILSLIEVLFSIGVCAMIGLLRSIKTP